MAWGSFESGGVGNILYLLDRFGIFEYLLPFMIYFLLLFGLLERISLFSKDDGKSKIGRKINVSLALSMSLIILYYVPASKSIGMYLSEILTKWGVFAIVLLLIPLTLAILGIEVKGLFYNDNGPTGLGWGFVGVVILSLVVVFYQTLGNMFRDYWILVDPNYVAIALLILLIGGAIIYIGSEGSSESDKSDSNRGKSSH